MTLPAIIDCDPGHDDAMAILLAGRTLELKGITTVHGNAPLAHTTRNARKIVEFAGLTGIPIAAGMDRPLVREPSYGTFVHGESGLDGPELPEPSAPVLDEHAVDFIYRTARAVDGLRLIPVGPLTNIGAALRRYPDLVDHIAEISLMGGSLTSGNRTVMAEFNIWADPDAAHIVFNSGIPLKMVGLNVTRQVPATPEMRTRIRTLGNRTSVIVADLLDFFSESVKKLFGLTGGSMNDPLAVAALVDPAILEFDAMRVDIELKGEHTYGMTVCDSRHRQPSATGSAARGTMLSTTHNAEVATGVDVSRFWDLFLDVLATYP